MRHAVDAGTGGCRAFEKIFTHPGVAADGLDHRPHPSDKVGAGQAKIGAIGQLCQQLEKRLPTRFGLQVVPLACTQHLLLLCRCVKPCSPGAAISRVLRRSLGRYRLWRIQLLAKGQW
ncbi:hypothetical protein D3C76_770820 [compost metagenome]